MSNPTVITCAVTGSPPTVGKHPAIPVTPKEIARACIDAAKAGAAVTHIHVRDPETGKPSTELALYREVVERVRASHVDVCVNLTCGPGGRYVPSPDDLSVAAPGTTLTTAERRVQHVIELRPEVCSLDFNTMMQSEFIMINWPQQLARMANLIRDAGTKPELEVFDTGDIRIARELIEGGDIDTPALFQICLGIKYGADATIASMMHMRSLLPDGSHWAGFGISRMEFPHGGPGLPPRRQRARRPRGQPVPRARRVHPRQRRAGRASGNDHREPGRPRRHPGRSAGDPEAQEAGAAAVRQAGGGVTPAGERPDALVGTEWLAARLGEPGLRVVDATWYRPSMGRDARAGFEACHIPGAVYLDIDDVADPGHRLKHMLPSAAVFAAKVGALGLGDGHRIVVYDGRGLYSAARVWWMFRVHGHDDIAVLDGGLGTWLAEGRPTASGPARPEPATFTPRPRPHLARSAEDVLANLASAAEQVVDTRSAGRFDGTEPEPYPGVRSGRIPGSRNLHWERLLDVDDKTVLAPERLADRLADAGVHEGSPVIASCGSGVTACILALALHLVGRDDWSVYDGSWTEWGGRPDLPIET